MKCKKMSLKKYENTINNFRITVKFGRQFVTPVPGIKITEFM